MFLSLIGMEKTAADVLAEGLEKIAGPSSALNLLESGQSLKRMLLRAQMSPQYSRDVASMLSSLGNPGRLTASLRQNPNLWPPKTMIKRMPVGGRIMETLRRIKLRPDKEPSLIDSMMRNSGMPGVMDMIKVTSLQKTAELEKNALTLKAITRLAPKATERFSDVLLGIEDAYKLPWIKNMNAQQFRANIDRINNILRRAELLPGGVTGAQLEDLVNLKGLKQIANQTGIKIPDLNGILEKVRTGSLWKTIDRGPQKSWFAKRYSREFIPGEILGGNMRWLAKLRRMYPR